MISLKVTRLKSFLWFIAKCLKVSKRIVLSNGSRLRQRNILFFHNYGFPSITGKLGRSVTIFSIWLSMK